MADRLVPVGRVGRAHGRDGAFYVEGADHPLSEGTTVRIAGHAATVHRRAGTDGRPLVALTGIEDREAAASLRGEVVMVDESDAPLGEAEWLAEDLVGCEVPGLGRVRRVVAGPSCDLLEVGPEAVLVPFVRDAVRAIDPATGVIEVDLGFLGLGERS